MSVAIDEMVARWINDEPFRAAMRLDPLGTADEYGLQLDPYERQALSALDLSASDEELAHHLNMGGS